MKVLWSSLYILQAQIANHSNIPIIKEVETRYLVKLSEWYGYEWAVRIGDLIMIATTVLFSFFLIFILSGNLVSKNPIHSIRFSDNLNGFVYMWAERKGVKEVVIKTPKTYRDRIEVIIAFMWIRFFDHVPLRERRARRLSAIIITIFILMILLMLISLSFALNVVANEKLLDMKY